MEATPSIFDCCEQNDTEGLKTIIQSGGDPNAKDDDEDTPLHFAAGYNSKECLLLLLEAGAEINAKGNGGWAPLHISALYGSKECLQLLIENGADANAKNEDGETPLNLIRDENLKKEMEEYANMISTLNIKEPGC
jgi:ankyrin repeat protein